MAYTDYIDAVQKMYIGYYQRPADPYGLVYWAQRLDAVGGDKSEIIAAFSTSDESEALYGTIDSTNIETVVDSIYMALFGRLADTAGRTFYVDGFNAGTFTPGTIVLNILDGATSTDKQSVDNKVTASNLFTQTIDPGLDGRDPQATYSSDDTAAAITWLAGVTDFPWTVPSQSETTAFVQTSIADTGDPIMGAVSGQTYTLTTGVDNKTGTSGNDTFIANYVVADLVNQLNDLDALDGGAGNDTLQVSVTGAALDTTALGLTIKNIETANFQGNKAITVDSTDWTGLTSLNVTKSVLAATLTAASTTAVSVAQADGAVTVTGGSTQTVSVGTAGGAIALCEAAGAVDVTVTKLGAQTITIDDGTSVNVTAAATNPGGTTGAITIGATTAPTGAVSVTNNLTNAAAVATDTTGGAIGVTGGSTVSVTQTATQAVMTTASTNSKIVQGAVTVTGGAATTDVTVNQTAAVAAVDTVLAVTGVTEVQTLTFAALTAGQTQIINGLTFTAGAAGTTAAQTAAAFANLDSGAKQGYSTLGTYSGDFTAGWTTGAVSGTSAVSFTKTATGAVGALADTGTGTDPTVVETVAGVTAVTATGKGGVDTGLVSIVDATYGVAGTDTITTVSVNAYKTASEVKSDALTSLSLANSGATTFNVYNNAATTLGLTIDNLAASSAVNLDAAAATYTTLNITATGANSDVDLTAAAVTTLSVGGTKAVNVTGSTFTALKTITVTGSAGLTGDADEADTLTSVNTTGTTGTVTATIDATKATYAGGAGVDNVTLSAVAPSKSVDLGAGNDKLTLATGTTALTSEMIGGDGTDTLVMAAADAVTASATTTFETKITGFDKLSLGAAAAVGTVNLANMDDISHVISANGVGGAIAEVQTFTVTAGTGAAVKEVQTFTITGAVGAAGAGNVLVGGVAVAVANNDTVAQVADKIAAASAAIIAGNPTIESVASDGVNLVTITYLNTAGNVANVVLDFTGTDATVSAVTEGTPGDTNAGNITIEGVAVAVTAGLSIDDVGALIAAANYGATTIDTVTYNSTTDTVTVTYVAGVDEGATTTVDTDGTGVTFGAVGTTTNGAATGGTGAALTLSNMANAGTLELTAAGAGATVTMADATGSADSLNIKVTADATTAAGIVTVANVESIAIESDDSGTTIDAVHTLTLVATKATSLTLTGDAGLTLTNTGNTALKTIDASGMTGALTVTAAGTVAETITGGSGADALKASATGKADVLIGGAGADSLYNNSGMSTLTGGDGFDTFYITTASTNVNSYSTITDATKGDYIVFTATAGTEAFKSAAVTLGDTAVFQDYANAAVNSLALGEIGWFQFGGNTYIVQDTDLATGIDSTTFVNGSDLVVKLTGLVDLSLASFDTTDIAIRIG